MQLIILTAIFMFIWVLASCTQVHSKSSVIAGDKPVTYKLDATSIISQQHSGLCQQLNIDAIIIIIVTNFLKINVVTCN